MENIKENESSTLHTNDLPILKYREDIIKMVNSQHVTVIQGDTGSGKSSQVPQFLLQDARERHVKPLILCTQPRRIAAISLAKRVADELGEPMGRSVGYMIGADRVVGRDTQIRFVTTGWAFEKLMHSENFLENVTHFVIDEVHERSIDADLLHLLIKLVLPKIPAEKRPRVVLMSATFNAAVFSDYYCPNDPPEPIFVGVKRYSVDIFHSDQFNAYLPLRRLQGSDRIDGTERNRLGIGAPANAMFIQICRTLHDYHLKRNEPCCILVFLSGLAEIDALWELIETVEEKDGAVVTVEDEELSFEEEVEHVDNMPKPAEVINPKSKKQALRRFQLCMLHSSVDKEDQMTVFTEIPHGRTRIILSTNIAESSVTIPNARYVIDAGYHKHMAFDHRLGCTSLRTVVASKAAAKQRSGRTGRLFPGVALRFYPEEFYNNMPEYDEPDMLRLPLFNTVLRLKVAGQDDAGFTSPLARPSEALSQAIDAPSSRSIHAAYDQLFRHGHMVAGTTDDLDDSIVTPLGKFLQKLNVDIRLGSLVVTALVLFPDYIAHAIVLAVSMSLQNVFVHANQRTGSQSFTNQQNFFSLISKVELHRGKFNGTMFSDAFTSLRAFGAQPTQPKPGWLHQHGLHGPRMHQLMSQARELAGRLAPLAPAHIASELSNLQARNYRFTFTDADARILRFMMLFSLSDQLLDGSVSLKSQIFANPKNVGFPKDRAPYADWQTCVFFEGIPMSIMAIGGPFEKLLLKPLFRDHGLNPRIHIGKEKYGGSCWVALEFASAKDAMFAQTVLEGCAKNGKLPFWIDYEEKVILPAPVARMKLTLSMMAHDTSAKLSGASAVSYLQTEGSHFFIPGQTVYVQSGVFVEDLTWFNGDDEVIQNCLALTRQARVTGPGDVVLENLSLDREFDPDHLRRLVYLKHAAIAAVSTQFSIRSRTDLGAEICRTILGIDPATVPAPALKVPVAAKGKAQQPTMRHKAKVIMIATVSDDECHAKLNVVASLTLQSLQRVAAMKVLKQSGGPSVAPDRTVIRVQRTGRVVTDDAVLKEAIEGDADAFNILRLQAYAKGMLVAQVNPAGGASGVLEEEEPEEDAPGRERVSKLSRAGPLRNDPEDDAWMCSKMREVLKLHSDGRMKVDQIVSTLKLCAKAPERINEHRVRDVVAVNGDEFFADHQFIALEGDSDEERGGEFLFGGGWAPPDDIAAVFQAPIPETPLSFQFDSISADSGAFTSPGSGGGKGKKKKGGKAKAKGKGSATKSLTEDLSKLNL